MNSQYAGPQWWLHFLCFQTNYVTVSKQTNQSMNRTIVQVILTSVCVINEKDMALQQQIWSTFITVLWCSKTKITNGTRILVLARVLQDKISKICWQFWHSFFKNAFKSNCNFNPIEIMWRKAVCSVCLIPVSMATWHMHMLWRFTLPAYNCKLVTGFTR